MDTFLEKKREKLWFKSGGGMWFRNSDNLQLTVYVTFYPRKKLYYFEGKERKSITIQELRKNYHRLRV